MRIIPGTIQLKNSQGFTLLEVLIATAVASLLLLMVSSSYKTVLNTIKEITGYAEFYENINLAVTKIERDIANAYFTPGSSTNDNFKVCFMGEVRNDNSSLNFVSTTHRDYNFLGSPDSSFPASDINEIGYYLIEDPEFPGMNFLIRREQIHYDSNPLEGGIENIILENVISLLFEFRENNDWTSAWDSPESNKTYPPAVKTTLKVKNFSGKEETYIFISRVNLNVK